MLVVKAGKDEDELESCEAVEGETVEPLPVLEALLGPTSSLPVDLADELRDELILELKSLSGAGWER